MAMVVYGNGREKQLTETEDSSKFFTSQSISNLPELRETVRIYFKKKD